MASESPLGLLLSLNRIFQQASGHAGRRAAALWPLPRPSFSLCFLCLDESSVSRGHPEAKRDSPGCLCSALTLRMVFTFLNGWKKKKRKIVFHDARNLHEIYIAVPINKGSLEHSHAHSFTYLPMAAFTLHTALHQRPYGPKSLNYLLSGPLPKKIPYSYIRLLKKKKRVLPTLK